MPEKGEGTRESARGRYDLSPETVRAMSARVLEERAGEIPDRYRFVAVELDGLDEYADIGRYVERVVFEQAFGNYAAEMEREYGPYEEASRFFVSFDRQETRPSGVLRVIANSEAGFKTFNDIASEPFFVDQDDAVRRHDIKDLDKVWDIGTVAVLPEYRRGEGPVSIQLYRALYMAALHEDVEHFVSVIDDGPLRKMRGYLGLMFNPLADAAPQPYLGSKKSHAVHAYLPELYGEADRHRKTVKGFIARKALDRLVRGSEDDSIALSPR